MCSLRGMLQGYGSIPLLNKWIDAHVPGIELRQLHSNWLETQLLFLYWTINCVIFIMVLWRSGVVICASQKEENEVGGSLFSECAPRIAKINFHETNTVHPAQLSKYCRTPDRKLRAILIFFPSSQPETEPNSYSCKFSPRTFVDMLGHDLVCGFGFPVSTWILESSDLATRALSCLLKQSHMFLNHFRSTISNVVSSGSKYSLGPGTRIFWGDSWQQIVSIANWISFCIQLYAEGGLEHRYLKMFGRKVYFRLHPVTGFPPSENDDSILALFKRMALFSAKIRWSIRLFGLFQYVLVIKLRMQSISLLQQLVHTSCLCVPWLRHFALSSARSKSWSF